MHKYLHICKKNSNFAAQNGLTREEKENEQDFELYHTAVDGIVGLFMCSGSGRKSGVVELPGKLQCRLSDRVL